MSSDARRASVPTSNQGSERERFEKLLTGILTVSKTELNAREVEYKKHSRQRRLQKQKSNE